MSLCKHIIMDEETTCIILWLKQEKKTAIIVPMTWKICERVVVTVNATTWSCENSFHWSQTGEHTGSGSPFFLTILKSSEQLRDVAISLRAKSL